MKNRKILSYPFLIMCACLLFLETRAQTEYEINGMEIKIPNEGQAYIQFPGVISNYKCGDAEAYSVKKRKNGGIESAINISANVPQAGQSSLEVTEGNRTHHFNLVFDPNYDINSDPPLRFILKI